MSAGGGMSCVSVASSTCFPLQEAIRSRMISYFADLEIDLVFLKKSAIWNIERELMS